MREYREATLRDLYNASLNEDMEFLYSVQTCLEDVGLRPVVVKNRKGEEVLSIKREWIEGDVAIKRYTWKELVSEALDSCRNSFEYYTAPMRKNASTAITQQNMRLAQEAKRHMRNIEPYV